MSPWPAAQPGDELGAIQTPALVLDLDAFERNLARMTRALAGSGVRLRPHAKSHKCPEIAHRQIADGAVGICCQKVSEAAAFVCAGIEDVLITNEIVGDAKLLRLADLAARTRLGVLVDDLANVMALGSVAQSQRVRLDVYVEVDVGAGRCGVAPGADAAELAVAILNQPALRYAGLHCYQGAAQHLRTGAARCSAIDRAVAAVRHSVDSITACGIRTEVVTGAGTGTFPLERDSRVYNEIQPGSYIFMDGDYAENVRAPCDIAFEHSLFVLTMVMSRPHAARAVVDAGLKAASVDSGLPGLWQRPDLVYRSASDEHGVLEARHGSTVAIGDLLLLVPGHCDPTVNLYDELVCIRGLSGGWSKPATAAAAVSAQRPALGPIRVEAIWPIAARGALL